MFDGSIVPWLVKGAAAALAATTAFHALLFRRDPRGAIGWIVACLAIPFAGPLVYLAFGVNRVQRRAQRMFPGPRIRLFPGPADLPHDEADIPACAVVPAPLGRLCHAGRALSNRAALPANRVETLLSGEETFPAVLEAIGGATRSVRLSTYIFERDAVGERFIQALSDAVDRGVAVHVLIDGVGSRYGRRAVRALREAGVTTVEFLPLRLYPPTPVINLRNHRKILTVDGAVAFTGGGNISARHLVRDPATPFPTQDTHFVLHGPIVGQLDRVFVDDWLFATGEALEPCDYPPPTAGTSVCRAMTDGPDDDLDKILLLLLSAVAEAHEEIVIQTPYFLPPRELLTALGAAALRGVRVDVLIPARSNLRFVDWATRNMLWETLQRGVNVREHPAPFDHTKFYAIDRSWTLVGSPNLDPRSLRLNFELGLEIYDPEFVACACDRFRDVWERSRAITLQEVDARSIPVRIRDSLAWLFWPYL